MLPKQLTPRQRQIFKFIKEYVEKNGYAPIYEDIGKAVGLTSSATIYNHIRALEKKGYIKRMKGVSRGLEILVDKEPRAKETIEISMLGYITGEGPLEEHKNDAQSMTIPYKHAPDISPETSFILQVKGSGLLTEGIFDGDFVLFEYKENAEHNDTVLVLLDNNIATIRKLKKQESGFTLTSATSPLHTISLEKPLIHGVVRGVYRFY